MPMHCNNKKSAPLKLVFGTALASVLLLLATNATGIANTGWAEGFHHPLQGWDHLLTMLAVGIWAAQLRGHAIWLLPLAFVGVMSLGGLAGAAGLAIPSVEGIILLSCAVFSLLIIRKVRFSTQVSVMIVAFFAFFHGFAHGHEISTSASLISYTSGFVLATLLLHGAGIIVARLVVLIATCLVALFFSGLAQATHSGSIATDKNQHTPYTQDKRSTRFSTSTETGTPGYSITRGSPDRPPLRHESTPKILVAFDSGPSLPAKANGNIKPYSCQISANSQAADPIGLALMQAAFPAQPNCNHNFKGVYPGSIPFNGVGFKHLYPDINHTPGKDLLSNGVGLTSPPTFKVNLVALHNPQPFRKTPVPPLERHRLQMPLAKPAFGNLPLKKIDSLPRKEAPIRIPSKANAAPRLRALQKNCLFYPPPKNPFKDPSRFAVGISSARIDFQRASQLSSWEIATPRPFI